MFGPERGCKMFGPEALLSSLGINPEEIKQKVLGFAEHVKQWMQRDEARMIAIEKSLQSLHAKLDGAEIEVETKPQLTAGENLNHG